MSLPSALVSTARFTFGEHRDKMEAEMMAKVKIAEARRLKATV